MKGAVVDQKTKEPIKGAIVQLHCTCLQQEKEVQTNDQGLFSFGELPSGKYQLFVLKGKANLEAKFDLSRGQRVSKKFIIDPDDEFKRTIVVKPMVAPKSTKTGRTYDMSEWGRVPVGDASRDNTGVIEATPGAQKVAGGISIGGGTPAESSYTVDGVAMNSPRFGTPTSGIVQEFLEEVEVLDAGYDAERGGASTGQVSNRLTSGTNVFRGIARFTFTPRLAKPRYIIATDNAVRAIEVPDYQMQGVVSMSGPIIKDRLFWSGGVVITGGRGSLIQSFHHRVDKDNSGGYDDCPYENGANDCVGGGDYIASKKFAEQKFKTGIVLPQLYGGLDWAINPKHRLSVSFFGAPSFQRRAFRRAPNANYDPSSFGNTFSTDPLGGGSLVANGIVNGTFGWDRSNSSTTALNYRGRVADDKLEIESTLGYGEYASIEAWKLDNPALKQTPVTQEVDAQGTNLFGLLDRDDRVSYVPGVEDACNNAQLPGLTCPTRQWLSGGIGPYSSGRTRRLEGMLALTHFFNAAGAHQLKYGARVEHLEDKSVSRYSGNNASDFYSRCSSEGLQGDGGEWCYDPSNDSYDISTANRVDNHRLIRVDTDNPDSRRTRGYGRIREEQGELRAIASPLGAGVRVDAYRARVSTQNYAIYLQDRWAIRSNLFLSAGMRWELQDMRDVLGRRAVFIWDNVAPRVGISYDWTDEGRSRLFASYGWFYQPLPLQLNSRVFGGLVQVGRTYRNADCAGGITLDSNGSHPRTEGGQPTEYCTDSPEFTTGLTPGAVVPRLRGQYNQQFQIGYEQEVIEDLTLGVRWLHTDLGRAVEDISTDGGNNFIIANPGVGVSADDMAKQQARCEQLNDQLATLEMDAANRPEVSREAKRCEFLVDAYGKVGSLFNKPRRNYDQFTFEVRKRFAKNWMVVGNYTYSRLVGNYDGYVDPLTGAINLGASSQYDLPELVRNSFGPLSTNTPHRFRIDGFYSFDLAEAGRLTLGTSFRYQSGYPISLKASNNRYGFGSVYLLPRGSGGRVEANYNWNLSIGYAYPLPGELELEVAVRWFNVTNAKAALRVDENYSFENSRAVAGGDLGDVKHAKIQGSQNPNDFFQRGVVSPQGNFGVQTAFQNPTAAQFDVILRF